MRILFLARYVFSALWLLAPTLTLASQPDQPWSTRNPGDCELILKGIPIESLVLSNERGEVQDIRKPGDRVWLPPGRYHITGIALRGGYYTCPSNSSDSNYSFSLTPDKPCRPKFSLPLTATVTAKRAGRLLQLDYRLSDSDGRLYSSDNNDNPPKFAVYQDDRLLYSGSFEYG